MAGKRWTQKENVILEQYYSIETQDYIKSLLSWRTWFAIVIQARKLNLYRSQINIKVSGRKKESYINGISKLEKILDESFEAYYWAGFIIADGHLYTQNKRLKITLALKDFDHLNKFCSFINSKSPAIYIKRNNCTVLLQDKNIIGPFIDKFKIVQNKTYSLKPIDIKDDKLFISFIAGFIDGDGSIKRLHNRKDVHIGVVGHSNTLPILNDWAKRIYALFPANITNSIITTGSMPFLDKSNYARWNISNYEIVKQVKQKIIELKLPVMERKWKIIDLAWRSRYTIANERKQKALKLRKMGMTRKEIAKELSISLTATYRYFDKDN